MSSGAKPPKADRRRERLVTGQLGEPGWAARALVYGAAPAGTACCRCNQQLLPQSPAASVPGLDDRGWAHVRCLPADLHATPDTPNTPGAATQATGEAVAGLRIRRAGAGRSLVVDEAGRVVADVERLGYRCWRVAVSGVTHAPPKFSTRREALEWLHDVIFPGPTAHGAR